jgi:hypothetical protein
LARTPDGVKSGGHYIAILHFSPSFDDILVSFKSSESGGKFYPGFRILGQAVVEIFAKYNAISPVLALLGVPRCWNEW